MNGIQKRVAEKMYYWAIRWFFTFSIPLLIMLGLVYFLPGIGRALMLPIAVCLICSGMFALFTFVHFMDWQFGGN